MAQKANDFLRKAWAKGWLPEPVLTPGELWRLAAKPYGARANAAESGGRPAEDVADFHERLERICAALHEEAQLNTLGLTVAYGQLMRVVKQRLAMGALWDKQPALLQTQLAPPIIVLGQMRSGTTRVHKLLSADPAHTHTRHMDAFHPVPAPPGLARLKSAFDIAMLTTLNPWLQSIHPMASGEVEEELAWLGAGLHHAIYEAQWHIPTFVEWSERRDSASIYREFARLLRSDAARRGNADRPRVIKVPAFCEDLPSLLHQFPNARLVVTHRDTAQVLRSSVSLVANQMAMQSDDADPSRIEAEWQRKIALREQRLEQGLADWDGPITRLDFDTLNDDWRVEIERAYGELGLTLSPNALAAMHRLNKGSAKGKHRAHAEQLRQFEQNR